MIENISFISVRKKEEKNKKKNILQNKNLSVYGEAHGRPLNTLRLFFAKCFIIIFVTLMKKKHI